MTEKRKHYYECAEGWYSILDEAVEKLSKLDGIEIVQIKEKFGELRLYTNHITDEAEAIIEEAEKKCAITCELCGESAANLRIRTGWLRTLCSPCAEERGYAEAVSDNPTEF